LRRRAENNGDGFARLGAATKKTAGQGMRPTIVQIYAHGGGVKGSGGKETRAAFLRETGDNA